MDICDESVILKNIEAAYISQEMLNLVSQRKDYKT